MATVRVRFAPSPTGQLHIGGARTALFNWLFARQNAGKMILRIDDTDKERSEDAYLKQIIDSLTWLGLDYDEGPDKGGEYGPYIQSQRLEIYRKEALRLVDEGKAFFCFCSREKLEKEKEKAISEGKTPKYPGFCRELSREEQEDLRKQDNNPVLRLKTPSDGVTLVNDLIRGEVSFDNNSIDDFIIMKSDFTPTYNFASVVDDFYMKITHIIRAEEHLSNTPRQILIGKSLGFPLPSFAHVPMILAPDRSKLSKRHGATSVEEFKEQGYLPQALINYLGLLGWSPGNNREIISLEEMVKLFDLNKVQKNAAVYDVQKLTWLNSVYMKQLEIQQLTELAFPFFQKYNEIDLSKRDTIPYLHKVVQALRERAKTLDEMGRTATYFFSDDFKFDDKGKKKHFLKQGSQDILKDLLSSITDLKEFNKETIVKAINDLKEKKNISISKVNPLFRLAITGTTGGPDLLEIAEIIGKQKTVSRIRNAIDYINDMQQY
ncbi:MAG: glutamate--tRNA ligase [Firmicutes bacterium]|nr:glutamate--tRNA ligase [Bacillota bacterium]